MYFAVVVMSTVGLGDISPRTFAGRMLTVVWIIIRSDWSPEISIDIKIRPALFHCVHMAMIFLSGFRTSHRVSLLMPCNTTTSL
jgi:hypothetical protein